MTAFQTAKNIPGRRTVSPHGRRPPSHGPAAQQTLATWLDSQRTSLRRTLQSPLHLLSRAMAAPGAACHGVLFEARTRRAVATCSDPLCLPLQAQKHRSPAALSSQQTKGEDVKSWPTKSVRSSSLKSTAMDSFPKAQAPPITKLLYFHLASSQHRFRRKAPRIRCRTTVRFLLVSLGLRRPTQTILTHKRTAAIRSNLMRCNRLVRRLTRHTASESRNVSPSGLAC